MPQILSEEVANVIRGMHRYSKIAYEQGKAWTDMAMASSIAKSPYTRWGIAGGLGLVGTGALASNWNNNYGMGRALPTAGTLAGIGGGIYAGSRWGKSFGPAGMLAGAGAGALLGSFVGNHPITSAAVGGAAFGLSRPGMRMRMRGWTSGLTQMLSNTVA